MGRRHDYFAADLHSLFRWACQRENITQEDVLQSGVGPCGHLWMGRESLRELDLEPEAIACLNYLSYI